MDVLSLSSTNRDQPCQEHVHHTQKSLEIESSIWLEAAGSPRELAEKFEPTEQTIRNWLKQTDRDDGIRSDGPTSEEKEEIRELRKKLRQLQQERDILAKATAWFAREKGDLPPNSSDS
ncbi:transposase [Salinibacter ruber]|uniref:hypothetical protein n=1 Tax=Salinibacter ruber TaxID=146919 RepID=UPI00216A2698|nr:hypothetical protein [Salinibacter ruber]MCS3830047.1 transposase [Salinibacter ruber]